MPQTDDVTSCPGDLDRLSKTTWRRTRSLIKKEGRWRPEYSLLLERYVRAVEVGRKARERIATREKELGRRRPGLEAEIRRLENAGEGISPDDTKRVREVRRELSRDAFTAFGSQGQLVQHPDLKTAREAERDANDYATALLLTPAARQKLGDEKPAPAGGKFGGVL